MNHTFLNILLQKTKSQVKIWITVLDATLYSQDSWFTANATEPRKKSVTSTPHQFTFHLTTTDRSITFSPKEPVSNLYVTEKAAMRNDTTRGWSYSAIWTSRDRQCKTDPDVTVLYWSSTRPHGKQNLYMFVQNTGQTEKLTRGDSHLNYPFFLLSCLNITQALYTDSDNNGWLLSYTLHIFFAGQNLSVLAHNSHARIDIHTIYAHRKGLSRFYLGLRKGVSKQESLQMCFEFRQSGKISQTGRQRITDRWSYEVGCS